MSKYTYYKIVSIYADINVLSNKDKDWRDRENCIWVATIENNKAYQYFNQLVINDKVYLEINETNSPLSPFSYCSGMNDYRYKCNALPVDPMYQGYYHPISKTDKEYFGCIFMLSDNAYFKHDMRLEIEFTYNVLFLKDV